MYTLIKSIKRCSVEDAVICCDILNGKYTYINCEMLNKDWNKIKLCWHIVGDKLINKLNRGR